MNTDTSTSRQSDKIGSAKKTLADTLHGKVILTVDDQHLVRMMLKSFLGQLGLDQRLIKGAENGADALVIVEQTMAALGFVLLDWNMPRVPGIEVLRKIRSTPELEKLPVLMITAETREEQIIQAVEEGVDGYIIKPFTAADLGEKMMNVIDPPEYTKIIDKAEVLIEEGDFERALDLLEKVLEKKPNSASARMLMGVAYKNMNDDVKARQMYEEAVEKNPKFIKALNSLSGFLVEKGETDEALAVMKKADQLSPLVTNRKISIGKINLEKGNAEDAHKYFNEASKLEPDKAEEIANVCLETGDAEMATEYITKSVTERLSRGKLDEDQVLDYIDQYNNAGIELRRKGLWEKAVQTYKSALDIDPKNPAVHYNIGKAYVQGSNLQAARLYFEKAVVYNRESPDPDPSLPKLVTSELTRLDGK